MGGKTEGVQTDHASLTLWNQCHDIDDVNEDLAS